MIKSRVLGWARDVARLGERRGAYRVLVRETLKKRYRLEDPDVDVRIILKWIFMRVDVGMDWIDMAQERDSRWAL